MDKNKFENKQTLTFSNVPLDKTMKEILNDAKKALEEKGYDPIDQMVGYILSGDPSYITSHNNARSMISKIDRDDLVEEILKAYFTDN